MVVVAAVQFSCTDVSSENVAKAVAQVREAARLG